jgi:hypothetical protein
MGIGASLSPTLSGLIVHYFGYPAGFASLAGEGLIALLVLAVFLPETKEQSQLSNSPSFGAAASEGNPNGRPT